MTAPVTARFGKFRIYLGSGVAPIVYAAPCGFTSKSLELSKKLSEVLIPDCDDPDAPIATGRDVESTSWSITGQGVAAAAAIPVWLDAYESTASVPVKIEIEFSTGTVTWVGAAQLESLKLGAESGGRVTIDVSIMGDGALTRSDTLP